MARWQPLPASLDNDTRRLVERLRALKEQTGLSLVDLAARTAYSKSAWHRYLNGGKFPPRPAVEALGRIAGADPAGLLALWGIAQHAGTGLRTPTPPTPRPRGPARRRLDLGAVVLTTVCTVLAAAAFLSGAVLSPTGPADDASDAASCRGESCQGRYPHPANCSQDARTESSVTVAAYVVRLRFSPTCSAVWSEVHTHTARGVREVSIKTGPEEGLTSYPRGRADGSTSPMLAASDPRTAEACAVVMDKLACASREAPEIVPAQGD
ncbi:DUF2690 domain-containing protein [Streptomyces lydicus]|uniref:helix-turn-helix domain-containing protein n=1 Tax=Streptomyces lydicus TaxID=47763 RepID=UPI0037A1A0CD